MQGQGLDTASGCKVYRGEVRISELADSVGVPVSTVRYYERIGLLAEPARTGSGYREYGEDSATQLLFVTRARRLSLSCDQILELLPIWGSTNCTSAHDEVARLIEDKKAEIAARIAELTALAAQLDPCAAFSMPHRLRRPAAPTSPAACQRAPEPLSPSRV